MNPIQQAMQLLQQHGQSLYDQQAINNAQANNFYQGYTASPDQIDMGKFNTSGAYNIGNSIANALPAGLAVGGGIKVLSKGNKEISMAQRILGRVPMVNDTQDMEALAQQTAKYGSMLRSSDPFQGVQDVKGLHEIPIIKEGGQVVRRLYYNSLNDAEKALQGLVLNPGENAYKPRPVMFKQ